MPIMFSRFGIAGTGCATTSILLALSMLGLSTAAVAGPSPEFEDCQLTAPGSLATRDAQCASMSVPEDYSAPDAAQIELRIARIEADTGEPAADPVFFFAGGPGQAATEAYVGMGRALQPTNRARDIVLIDQRGTGGSNALRCPFDRNDLLEEINPEQVVANTRKCLAELDADPRHYTTTIAMRDYERVREALGYHRINLLGVSYGTRAAQTYLRLYPQRVRSVVLAGVVPPTLALGVEHAPNLDRALDGLFRRCRQTGECRERFSDPGATLSTLLTRIEEGAPTITMRTPTTGESETIDVSRDLVSASLRLLSYASESQAIIPLLLDQAEAGDWQPLLSQALALDEEFDRQFSRGMELSVVCSEDVPRFPAEVDHGDTLMGDLMVELLREQCAIWPRGRMPGDFAEPLADSPVPALLLSGALDPVTPPRYGEQAARQFRHAAHWVAPGRSHAALRHGCIPDRIADFFDTADPDALESECLDRIGPTPFFLGPTGPMP